MSKKEQRRYRRITVDLPASIVINNTDAYEGRLLNMSPGDLAVQVDAKASVGDAAVVRVKGLDVVEGTIARTFPDGFALSFLLSKKRRALLTEQLMILANGALAAPLKDDRRGSLRHRDENKRTVCRLADGSALFVKIIEFSVDGVSVDAPRRPAIGSAIHVGRTPGVVVRHIPRGFVVAYDAEGDPEQQTPTAQVS